MNRRQSFALGLLGAALSLFVVSLTIAPPSDVLLAYYQNFVHFVDTHTAAALFTFALAYVVITALGTPGSALMTVAGGVLFGGLIGGSISILSASAGGAILFTAVRAGFAETLARRVPQRFAMLTENFRDNAFYYLLFLRLMPFLPFFAVNIIAAAVGMRLSSFAIATVAGIAPMNFALALTGAGLQDVMTQQADSFQACKARGEAVCVSLSAGDFLNTSILLPLAALAVMAIFPVIGRRLFAQRIRKPS